MGDYACPISLNSRNTSSSLRLSSVYCVEAAIAAVLKEGKDVNADLGGKASTSHYADAVIAKMR